MIFSSLFEASAVAVLSLHRFRLQCYCSVLALPLYMFVVAVLTTLPSLCYAMSSLLRGCLLRSTRRIMLVGVLRMSFGGKVSPARISSHLLCLLFEIACSGGSKGEAREARASPYFQTKLRLVGPKKTFLGPPPYQRVWMTAPAPLSQGLDLALDR